MMVFSKIVEEERYYKLDNQLVKMMHFQILFMRVNKLQNLNPISSLLMYIFNSIIGCSWL